MAVAYVSVQTSNSGTTSVTVTKPTSLAEGDFMVAHCAGSNASATALATAYTLSGWTAIAGTQSNSGTASHRADALYKIATAGDVAASDFTFTGDADLESSCGSIYRFTGASLATGAADDDQSATSHTFANTLTPSFADSLMLMLTSCANNGGTTWSTYAITTDNPTWTERYDITNTGAAGDGDTTMAGATASRPEVSATGNSTASSAASVTDSVGIVVAVYPTVSVTVSGAVGSIAVNGNVGTVTGDGVVAGAVGSIVLNGNSGTATEVTPDWTNTSKGSADTWTNTSK